MVPEIEAAAGQSSPARRLLLVDDDPLSREVLRRRLARRDFEIDEAASGEAALERVAGGGIDLVLLDLRMPGLDGVETLRRIRTEHSQTRLPVIMLSAEEGTSRVIEALAAGASDYVVKSSDFRVLEARLDTQLTLRDLMEKVETLAERDGLTGLLNRRAFIERAEREIGRTRRYGGPLHVVLADLDRFKRINDRHGHRTGDRVLVAVSRCFRSQLRTHDLIGRWGGEEFALLLPETGPDGSLRTAERLGRAVAGLRVVGPAGDAVPVTMSAGMARFSTECQDLTRLLHRADQALYLAKRAGRNRVRVWQRGTVSGASVPGPGEERAAAGELPGPAS